jgi:hypothetical protein
MVPSTIKLYKTLIAQQSSLVPKVLSVSPKYSRLLLLIQMETCRCMCVPMAFIYTQSRVSQSDSLIQCSMIDDDGYGCPAFTIGNCPKKPSNARTKKKEFHSKNIKYEVAVAIATGTAGTLGSKMERVSASVGAFLPIKNQILDIRSVFPGAKQGTKVRTKLLQDVLVWTVMLHT